MNLKANHDRINEIIDDYGICDESQNVTAYEKIDQILLNQYLIMTILSAQAPQIMTEPIEKALKQTERCLSSCIIK